MGNNRFIAQVGLGYWGKNILRNLYQLGVLHTACEVNQTLMNQYRQQYPGVNFTESFEEILSNPDIKAVVISTPAATHYQLAKKPFLPAKTYWWRNPLLSMSARGKSW